MGRAILYDSTLCIGCRECEKACAGKWGLPYNDKIAVGRKVVGPQADNDSRFRRSFQPEALHALQRADLRFGVSRRGLHENPLGPVVYDASKCIGCRYCMQACPFQVPTYEWTKIAPRVRKCDMCYERQMAGKVTACTEACPVQATMNGDRDALLAEARKRLAEKPKDYYPRIYGLEEVGGTSVLMLSAVPFDQIGLKTNLPDSPLPPLTMNVLSLIPNIVSSGAVLLGGIYWLSHRKRAVALAEGRKRKS